MPTLPDTSGRCLLDFRGVVVGTEPRCVELGEGLVTLAINRPKARDAVNADTATGIEEGINVLAVQSAAEHGVPIREATRPPNPIEGGAAWRRSAGSVRPTKFSELARYARAAPALGRRFGPRRARNELAQPGTKCLNVQVSVLIGTNVAGPDSLRIDPLG